MTRAAGGLAAPKRALRALLAHEGHTCQEGQGALQRLGGAGRPGGRKENLAGSQYTGLL